MAEKYILSRIEGEYAYLKRESDGEELFIALALLPFGADEADFRDDDLDADDDEEGNED